MNKTTNPNSSNVTVPAANTSARSIYFSVGNECVLELNSEGFVYKGKVIEDAGKAHEIFLTVMNNMNNSLTTKYRSDLRIRETSK